MIHPIHRVRMFEIVAPYTLVVQFDDNTEQRIDFRPVLAGELFGPLLDLSLFNRVRLDPEVKTLVWPNDADFDPATLHDWPAIFTKSLPSLEEVRKFAAGLHAKGVDWKGEAFGWEAEYSAELPRPPLDSKLTFTPADFCIGESGIWFFSMSWERGRDVEPIEFLDDRALQKN